MLDEEADLDGFQLSIVIVVCLLEHSHKLLRFLLSVDFVIKPLQHVLLAIDGSVLASPKNIFHEVVYRYFATRLFQLCEKLLDL